MSPIHLPKEPFEKDWQGPWAGGAWGKLETMLHSPLRLEAALCFLQPAVWVAKFNSPWSSFSPHLPFSFKNFSFSFFL